MNTRLALVVTPLLAACTVVEAPIAAALPAQGLRQVDVHVERGAVRYTAANPHQVDVRGQAWGRASDEAVAQERLDGVWWTAERAGSTAVIASGAGSGSAGTTLEVVGPAPVGLTATVRSGDIQVQGVRGPLVLLADDIEVTDASGSADLLATWGDVSASLQPLPGDTIRVEADGDIHLALPWGLPYDLQVWGDAESQVVVEDLGFQYVMQDGPYLAAYAGSGSVRVDVIARSGDVFIHPQYGW